MEDVKFKTKPKSQCKIKLTQYKLILLHINDFSFNFKIKDTVLFIQNQAVYSGITRIHLDRILSLLRKSSEFTLNLSG